jgi:hypothetical protein
MNAMWTIAQLGGLGQFVPLVETFCIGRYKDGWFGSRGHPPALDISVFVRDTCKQLYAAWYPHIRCVDVDVATVNDLYRPERDATRQDDVVHPGSRTAANSVETRHTT